MYTNLVAAKAKDRPSKLMAVILDIRGVRVLISLKYKPFDRGLRVVDGLAQGYPELVEG